MTTLSFLINDDGIAIADKKILSADNAYILIRITLENHKIKKLKAVYTCDSKQVTFETEETLIKIEASLLNKKFYSFFNYYVQSFEGMISGESVTSPILKELLKFIADFWNIFGDSVHPVGSPEGSKNSELEDINCLYAASLGYGN